MDANSAVIRVGNTYQMISVRKAPLDRSGRVRKAHDWTLFLDVVAGDPDIIQSVVFDLGSTFRPSSFVCSYPFRVGQNRWRFSTRQIAYGTVDANIVIVGVGGSRKVLNHSIEFYNAVGQEDVFVEHNELRSLRMIEVAPNQNFGIELELTTPADMSLEHIGSTLTRRTQGRFGRIAVIQDYCQARPTREVWKIVPDSSIVCSRSSPDCTTFELVSPVLTGNDGIHQASQVVDALRKVHPQVNKSMGFHVHVDVSALTFEQIVRVCQNFIKYEDVMDAFVPSSRRTGSAECDQYFESNRQALTMRGYSTNKERHMALESCRTMKDLAALMNPLGRYYKLNLQNLISGRQPTLEFRQHSATTNSGKVGAWVRFCTAMVNNSARFRSPTPLREDRDLDFQWGAVFRFVIKDRALQEYYQVRRKELALEENEQDIACCSGCAQRGTCEAHGQSEKPKKITYEVGGGYLLQKNWL